MAVFDRIVVVTKPTELDGLRSRFASRSASEFYLRSRGQSIGHFESEARAYRSALDTVLAALPELPRVLVARAELPAFLWREKDLAVVIGPDGLVINAARYLDGQPVLGVNPNPASIAGTLVRFAASSSLQRTFDRVLGQKFSVSRIALAEARLNDGRVLTAVNDFLVGRLDQVSARYRIAVGGRAERQSSSGVLVATALGRNAWLKSIVTGAARITAALAGASAPPEGRGALTEAGPDVAWDDRSLVYAVREPFPTQATSSGLVFGTLAPPGAVEVVSEMAEGGAIVSDGVVEDFVPFNAGASVSIASSARRVRLIVAA